MSASLWRPCPKCEGRGRAAQAHFVRQQLVEDDSGPDLVYREVYLWRCKQGHEHTTPVETVNEPLEG